MSLLVPGPNRFTWAFDSRTDRPSATDGTSTTPGNNTKGSYSSAIVSAANMANDAWWVEIYISSGAGSAAARDTLVDIGMDAAGGTSYSVLIPDLLGSSSSPYATFGGHRYAFPLHIPAGAQLAARSSVNNATGGNPRVAIAVYGCPTNPELLWKGHAVEALGIVSGSSRGTSITSGTTSEGSWTSLGALSNDAHFFEVGFGINNATMAALGYHLDVGCGVSTGDVVVIQDALASTTSAEQVTKPAYGKFADIAAGLNVYGRMQCSGTADTGLSMAAYAVT